MQREWKDSQTRPLRRNKPTNLENVEANGARVVDVAVVNSRAKRDLGWLERVAAKCTTRGRACVCQRRLPTHASPQRFNVHRNRKQEKVHGQWNVARCGGGGGGVSLLREVDVEEEDAARVIRVGGACCAAAVTDVREQKGARVS
jgi:hypothetical protein